VIKEILLNGLCNEHIFIYLIIYDIGYIVIFIFILIYGYYIYNYTIIIVQPYPYSSMALSLSNIFPKIKSLII
jgi:hypothetical protein